MTDGPSYYIEYFHSVSLTKADIDQIGQENLSFISTILFAANEMFIYQKVLSAHIQKPNQRYNEIRTLSFIHQSTILRTLSAKIVEFIKLFEDQNKIWGRKGLLNEVKIMQPNTDQLQSLKESEFFNFTISMRDTFINHYIVSEISKNLPYLTDQADYSLQLHQEQGNSFFPIGEEVVFIGFINRFFKDSKIINSKEKKSEFLKDWISWVLDSLKWVNSVVQSFSKFIIMERLDGKVARRNILYLEPGLVADIHKFRSPLILRDRRDRK